MKRILAATIPLLLLAVARLAAGQSLDVTTPQPAAGNLRSVATSGLAVSLPRLTGRSAVLVVPSPGMDTSKLADLNEDLEIMCRLLDTLLGKAQIQTRASSSSWAQPRSSTRALLLPGFGALFAIEVDFPLAPAPEREAQDENGAKDALWHKVRDELRGRTSRRGGSARSPAPVYSELRVSSLKRTLLDAVKHTGNIRHLRPADGILMVAVESRSARSTDARGCSQPANIMVLQTTKKEADGLLNGRIEAGAFGRNRSFLTYQQASPTTASPSH